MLPRRLTKMKRIYVEPFHENHEGFREKVIAALRRWPRVALMNSPQQADAVLDGASRRVTDGVAGVLRIRDRESEHEFWSRVVVCRDHTDDRPPEVQLVEQLRYDVEAIEHPTPQQREME